MQIFIKSAGVISPQASHQADHFPGEIHEQVSDRLRCIEPEYRNLINPLLLRRMPRILKMGLAAAQLCINRAGGINPDGIIAGTGLGCLDNLEKFLTDVLRNQEHVTSVLPFINSTHNAVAAQISMLLKNHNYNTTYCHRGFSFESALQDAMMLIEENHDRNVLVGGIDELTDDFVKIHQYLNVWKKPVSNMELLLHKTAGTIAGEGASFFMLSQEPYKEKTGTVISGLHTFLTSVHHDISEIEAEINLFLSHHHTDVSEIGAVMMGFNGDVAHDRNFYALSENYFSKQYILYYKHLCGEYYTSSGFAFWLGALILSQQKIPAIIELRKGNARSLQHLLIYNQVNLTEHTLILLKHGRV